MAAGTRDTKRSLSLHCSAAEESREQRVARLAAQVRAGTYRPNLDAIAYGLWAGRGAALAACAASAHLC